MNQRGYTLIEVLIASSIFVVIMIIGTATFTTANRIREKTEAITLTTETARSVAESISRDLRAATGIRDVSGAFTILPFTLGQGRESTTGLATGTLLQTVRFDGNVGDQGETVVHDYFVDGDTPDTLTLKVRARTFNGTPATLDIPVPDEEVTTLLPAQLVLAQNGFTVTGLTHGEATTLQKQPFAQLHLALRYVGDPRNAGITQTVQTSVTSREYLE